MKKLPNGISNYYELVDEDYIYVDKTKYIEKLENLSDKRIMYLRPRKFGKTLFTSTLENYYDILKENEFEKLFKNTYIGKNPTKNKNRYYILRFNFSGIDTTDYNTTIKGFKRKIAASIEVFVKKYKLDFYVNDEDEAEVITDNLFKAFYIQKYNEKIFIIIDEYDHFANELLGFRTKEFSELLEKNGKVRKWYEILKEGTETIVNRIFITGVAPITLDSLTSGFNISKDLTREIEFNEMLGFTEDEVKYLMKEVGINEEKQMELLPIIKRNYDGYIFSNQIEGDFEKFKMYNSNMTLFFLNSYLQLGRVPNELLDVNIASDYNKIEAMINLSKEKNIDILEKIVAEEEIESEITEKFNPELEFGRKELISLLYYLGYITIVGKGYSKVKFKVPNDVIKDLYSKYFLKYISKKANILVDYIDTEAINKEILEYGKIDKIIDILREYLENLSNRDYLRFDEKYIKVIFYTIVRMLGTLYVKSEVELAGGYADILMFPKETFEEKYSILIEFKYIKKEEYEKDKSVLKIKQDEAKKQIKKYCEADEIKKIEKLKKYSIIAIKDKLIIQEILN